MSDWTGNKKTTFYDIPSYKGRLKINKNGEVYSLITNKLLKTSILPNGYVVLIIMLKKPRKSKTLYLHRLIAETFIPNPEHKPQVNHKNGIKTDNRIENLEWCTQEENNVHALKSGLRKPNINKILKINKLKRKLTIEQVKIIKQNRHLKTKELCNILNLNYKEFKHCVYDVLRGRSFKYDQ